MKDYVAFFNVGLQLVTSSGMNVFKDDINFFNIHLLGGLKIVKSVVNI